MAWDESHYLHISSGQDRLFTSGNFVKHILFKSVEAWIIPDTTTSTSWVNRFGEISRYFFSRSVKISRHLSKKTLSTAARRAASWVESNPEPSRQILTQSLEIFLVKLSLNWSFVKAWINYGNRFLRGFHITFWIAERSPHRTSLGTIIFLHRESALYIIPFYE